MYNRRNYRNMYSSISKSMSNYSTANYGGYDSVPSDLKIVNAVTGEIMKSKDEIAKEEKLKKEQIDLKDLEGFKDPYLELLEGIRTMEKYFPNSYYYIEVPGKALLTLQEIKDGYYIEKSEYEVNGEKFVIENRVKTALPLLEILRIRSLGYNFSLIDKNDLLPMYKECESILIASDPERMLSYNRLPYNQEVIDEITRFKTDIETRHSWIFYVPKVEQENIMKKKFGNLFDIITDMDNKISELNTRDKIGLDAFSVEEIPEETLKNMTTYRKKY